MLDRIDDFFNNLDVQNAKLYSKVYFNVIFEDRELIQALPFIKACWRDYLNPNTKEKFINQLVVATNQNTANKILNVINKLLKIYNIN
ncbi:MAG: hypothetical protein IJV94_02000 [Bacilli bacterium]|nr:hypothetical protein [Bacilli bacterium]